MDEFLRDQFKEGVLPVLGLLLGFVGSQGYGYWRRHRDRGKLLTGDARDTVVIEHHLVEPATDMNGDAVANRPGTLRIRSLGQAELPIVVPNDHLAKTLTRRAMHVTPMDTLIAMDGAEGSYLLETLTNFVCDRVGSAPFERDLYVMAPCCEPAGLANFQPITILLVRACDLESFCDWERCKDVQVEHGSDGSRVLTLMALASRYHAEQARLAALRESGERTLHAETMFVLDLALDRRAAPIPTKPIPWDRFGRVTWLLS